MTQHDLSSVLIFQLFGQLYQIYYPWDASHEFTVEDVAECLFTTPLNTVQYSYYLCFEPALNPLSTIKLEEVPDLIRYLPPPEAPKVPEQAVGMMLLLDQSTRMSLRGIDRRWISCHFDMLVKDLARRPVALPWAVRPDNSSRWSDLGFGFVHSALRRDMLYGPLIHSKRCSDQQLQLELVEALQRETEAHFLAIDSTRAHGLDDAVEVTAFVRLATLGPRDLRHVNSKT